MRKYIYIAAALFTAACVNEDIAPIAPEEVTTPNIVVPEGATEGEVIIKFKPEMEAILDQTMTRSGGVATRSGIPSTDEVLEILNAYHFERVFPVDERHEERTRESGLHLWYIVRFDPEENLASAMERLSKLGEVDKLQCNRPIQRAYNPASEPRFISCEEANGNTTRSTNWAFNDPEIYRQWCYINDGTAPFTQE
jgi:hypothetical protein